MFPLLMSKPKGTGILPMSHEKSSVGILVLVGIGTLLFVLLSFPSQLTVGVLLFYSRFTLEKCRE